MKKNIIKYCSTCLNHTGLFQKKGFEKIRSKPKKFKDGICTVCSYEKLKKNKKINWDKRQKILKEITSWGKKNRISNYDCIIPVSGGKDSLKQALIVRDKLKLKPLLVNCSYPPEQITELGAKNYSNMIENGFDAISMTLDPVKWKDLMKHSFLKFGNWCRSTEMALYSIPIHIALAYKIKLLFYGENFLYTVAHGTQEEGEDWDAKYISLGGNTTKGGPKSLRYKKADKLDYYFYNYPSLKEIEKANMKIVYLGWFYKDWYGFNNAKFSIKNGLQKRKKNNPAKTGDLWGVSSLDEDHTLVNHHIKYLKKGYGLVTDQVCEGIHQGLFSRTEGIKLLEKYDGKVDEIYIDKFCKYLEISKKTYNETVDKFVNKDLFEKKRGRWVRKFKIL